MEKGSSPQSGNSAAGSPPSAESTFVMVPRATPSAPKTPPSASKALASSHKTPPSAPTSPQFSPLTPERLRILQNSIDNSPPHDAQAIDRAMKQMISKLAVLETALGDRDRRMRAAVDEQFDQVLRERKEVFDKEMRLMRDMKDLMAACEEQLEKSMRVYNDAKNRTG